MATPERDEDTTNPKNPPNSVMHPKSGSTTLYLCLSAIALLCVIVGVVAIFWMAAHPPSLNSGGENVVSTSGYSVEGGHDPDPRPSSTRDEMKFRGYKSQAADTSF